MNENFVDLCFCGFLVLCFKDNILWWRGFDFLMKYEFEWLKVKIKEGLEVKMEVKK